MDGAPGAEENGDGPDVDIPQPRVPDYERIQNARNRRKIQIKEWLQYDKKMTRESEKLQRKGLSPPAERGFFRGRAAVKFPQSLIFLEAAARGDLDEVRKLLSEGVCPNVANENGLTALHQCCIDNTREMCQLLLRFGADPNARDSEQWTPLHAAATCNHTDLCKILIDHNADLLAMNADGNMPYECCIPGPTLHLIETEMDRRGITQEQLDDLHRIPECQMMNDMVTLCKAGTNLDQLDEQGANWLHIAAASGFEDVTQFLIRNGAKVDALDKDGWQAIHIAACWDHLEIIEILVNCGADIMAETSAGETVFDICEDLEMHARLNEIKEEMERRKTRQTSLSHSDRPRESVRRRSSTNPRSASIRRTSMREKKMISWKEAKQEAEMRGTSQLDVAESELPTGTGPITTSPSSGERRIPSPLSANAPTTTKSSQLPTSPTGSTDMTFPNADVPIWSPKPRSTHPSTSSSVSHSRLPNGSQSPRGSSKAGTEKPNPKLLGEESSDHPPRNSTDTDRTRHSTGIREPNIHPSRVTQRPLTVSEFHPIPSPGTKARTSSKERSSVRPEQSRNNDRANPQSPNQSRRSDSSRRPIGSSTEPFDKLDSPAPNITAHNAYYTQPVSNNNHVQSNRISTIPRGSKSSGPTSRKQKTPRTAPRVVPRKRTMPMIELGGDSQMSGKCCTIM